VGIIYVAHCFSRTHILRISGNNECITRRKPLDMKEERFMLDRTSLIITIIGAINWLLVGLFQFDLVAYICGGQSAVLSRIIYTVVGIAGLWCISLLFRERKTAADSDTI